MFYLNISSSLCFMLGGSWFALFLQAILFVEMVICKRICYAVISNCPSDNQKWDSKDNGL